MPYVEGPSSTGPPGQRLGRWQRAITFAGRAEVVACGAVVIPMLIAVVRAIGQRSIPIGDNALFVIRSRDVFSLSHFPLLGTASSASLGAGTGLNHPGPLLFDLLALPVRALGGTAGVATGIGLINIAAAIGIAVVGHRIYGATGSLLATAAVAVLAWTLGSAILVEPWNPHVLILPFLLLLFLAAGVAGGDVVLLPVMIAVGSLCLQTHISYAVIVPLLSAAAVVGAVLVFRRRWRSDPNCRSADRPLLRRIGLISTGTFLLLWMQPLAELVSNGSDGNLIKLVTSDRADEPTVGIRLGVRLIGSVVALPSGWGRSSFVTAIPDTGYEADGVSVRPTGVASLTLSIAALAAVVVVVGLLGRWSWRRRDRTAVAVSAIVGAALVACVITLGVMPFGPLGLRAHQMRWLWAIGPFVLFAIALGIVAAFASHPRRGRSRGRTVRIVLGVTIAGFAIANLPAFVQGAGPNSETGAIPVARRLADQIGNVDLEGAVVFDPTGSRFAEPYSPVVLAALQANDQPWFVSDEYLIRQFGESRRAAGDEQVRLTVVEGRAALESPTGADRIALVTPLSDDEVTALVDGERELVQLIEFAGLPLTPQGEALVISNRYLVALDTIVAADDNAEFLVASGTVAQLVTDGALEIPAAAAELFERVSALRQRVGTDTVAVFVTPADQPATDEP